VRQEPFRQTLSGLLKARFPLLYLETWEEERALGEIEAVAADPAWVRTPRKVLTWSQTTGLVAAGQSPSRSGQNACAALDTVLSADEPAVFVFKDLHTDLGHGGRPADPALVRRLRDVVAFLRTCPVPVTVVLLSPVLQLPVELEKSVTVVDFPLPDERELRGLLDDMVASNGSVRVSASDDDRERIVKAAVGLTTHEAENAFARAMAEDGTLGSSDIDLILAEKRQTIRKSGILEFVPTGPTFDDVGGLENLKRWLGKRANSWLSVAAEYGVPPPKGVLITGVPGCGKSLTAKCTAALWELPLLRLDVGRVFAGLVGSSEQNMRAAIRTAESIAPSIMWIDEIEKGFGGADAGAGDSGTAQRVFGTFLTWLQDKSAPVFVVATANNIDRLPPEFLRKGRFDEIFFVDLPTKRERVPIWRVHLDKRVRGAAAGALKPTDALLEELAEATEGFSGAEIEQAVVTALFDAFAERRPLERADLLDAVGTTVPLSVTQQEQIRQIRSWADVRAVAATAQTDRDAYLAGVAGDAGGKPDGAGTAEIGRYRGGRTVDF
jgi:AAA+ superfamily predicted ATPase